MKHQAKKDGNRKENQMTEYKNNDLSCAYVTFRCFEFLEYPSVVRQTVSKSFL